MKDLDEPDLGSTLTLLRPRMTSVALRFAPSRDAAEDIVQSAFEKALRHLEQFRGGAQLSTWIHRIVVNESLMWLRSEKRRSWRLLDVEECDQSEWADADLDPSQDLIARERAERLRQSIAALPPGEQEVLLLCALQDVSYEEFHLRTGVRPAAAKSRAFRGRRRLRELLGEV